MSTQIDELTFAKSFLSSLTTKALKSTPSHNTSRPITNALLPPMPTSKRKRSAPTNPTSQTVTLTAKSLRGPAVNVVLNDVDARTTWLNIRDRVAAEIGLGGEADKVRVLVKAKPVVVSKTVGEVLGEGVTEGTVQVMLMGGVVPKAKEEVPEPVKEVGGTKVQGAQDVEAVLQGSTGTAEVKAQTTSKEFWVDLREWIAARSDVGEKEKVYEAFKQGYQAQFGSLPDRV
ncbi:hypothetical protein SAICODRAFT_30221 [Saitoella complicata NRRL Y-17804]|uniref:uncharacterized protein n=1 Tax=Saitoella complicata (strain BCRC 22490 / CBS 7301 / JCM 7358 / NBRC 10748 / NRRL Y-17804) TaxID=698492 RepID=UPI000866BBE0|nr:uncharacterized protein SAICODRAFT_30221 [Saitoella complicata NRRL Y-17804]ODQ53134.1 hypothetical protein SAICODRAFT_30221 [Saitoella complicata NRRL Y-17804]